MCLALVDTTGAGRYQLVVIANRDEFHDRPSLPLNWQADGILSGRDLKAGGTWMGVSRSGMFALLTNIRNPSAVKPTHSISRGLLVDQVLKQPDALFQLDLSRYEGFNLLSGDLRTGDFLCVHNAWLQQPGATKPEAVRLTNGVHCLSNATLNVEWPKTLKLRERYRQAMSLKQQTEQGLIEALFQTLEDTSISEDRDLPATGVPLEWERMLSAIKIVNPLYGTRASSVLLQRKDGSILLCEKSWGTDGNPIDFVREEFKLPLLS